MPIFTNRLEAKLKELGVLEKAKRNAIENDPNNCDNRNCASVGSAFCWEDTEEGWDFWNDIKNKTKFTF